MVRKPDITHEYLEAFWEAKEDKPIPEAMVFSGWSLGDITRANDIGLTHLGLTYQQPNAANYLQNEFEHCINTGLRMIYPIGPTGADGKKIEVSTDEISHATTEEVQEWGRQVAETVKEVLDNPVLNHKVSAWYLTTEELRWWREKEAYLIKRMYLEIKRADPKGRPVFMYAPQHSDYNRLRHFRNDSDWVVVGIYPHLKGHDRQRIRVKHVVKEMVKASHGRKVIPVLEMFEDNKHPFKVEDIPLIPAFLRHDMFCSLANGADGFLFWSMYPRGGFNTYENHILGYTETIKEVKTYEEFFIHGTRLETPVTVSGEQTASFMWETEEFTHDRVTVTEWTLDRRILTIAVNSSDIKADIHHGHVKETLEPWGVSIDLRV